MRPKWPTASSEIRRDVLPDRDVALDADRVAAELPHQRHRLVRARLRASVVHGHARPLTREPLGDRDPEPAPGAGDEGDLPGEAAVHASSS